MICVYLLLKQKGRIFIITKPYILIITFIIYNVLWIQISDKQEIDTYRIFFIVLFLNIKLFYKV